MAGAICWSTTPPNPITPQRTAVSACGKCCSVQIQIAVEYSKKHFSGKRLGVAHDCLADAEIKLGGCTAALSRNLEQADAVLVPKHFARRRFAEDARVSERYLAGNDVRLTRNSFCADAGQRIAVMVDINNFGKIVTAPIDLQARAFLGLSPGK